MGSWFSGPSTRIKLSVYDLRTGRAHAINIDDPQKCTVAELVSMIRQRITDIGEDEMSLKFSQKELADKGNELLSDIAGLKEKPRLFVEKVESKGSLARPWTLHIRTLTGREYSVSVSSPQDVCVLGFKLLVQDVSGISPDQLRLVIDGKQMEDGPGNQPNSITSYPAISNECTVHLVLKGR